MPVAFPVLQKRENTSDSVSMSGRVTFMSPHPNRARV
jgi:hypothetical protein